MAIDATTKAKIAESVKRSAMRRKICRAIGMEPFPQQAAVYTALDHGAKSIAINKGTRGGGTQCLHIPIVVEAAFPPDGQQPIRTIPIIAPYKELADRAFRMVWNTVIRKNAYKAIVPDFNPIKSCKKSERERYIEFPWAARIIICTADNPDSMLGEGWPMVLCDEMARWKAGVYEEYVERAMLDVGGVSILNSSPKGMNHWRDRYVDWSEQARTDRQYFTITWTSYDNPYSNKAALDKIRAEYERRGLMDLFRMNFLAEFTALQGAIYGMFREWNAGEPWHVDRVEFDPETPVVLGIDWGENFRCLFGQIAEWDAINIFDEVAILENAPNKQLNAVMEKLEYYAKLAGIDDTSDLVTQAYCDPSGKQMKTHFQNAGIPVYWTSPEEKRTINDVDDGINAVQWRFSEPERPLIRIDRAHCPDLISRIPAYERNSNTQRPVKENDHSVDALRYLVVGCFGFVTDPPEIFFA